ncbi:uncharacterized protein METZ01_LOCUS364663, partial [marine metagenome]
MDIILSIDKACFLFINNNLSNSLFDYIMPIFDKTKYFVPILLLPWLYAVFNDKPNRWKLVCLIPLVIILTDQSGLFIKKIVLRPRPWAELDPEMVRHLLDQKGKNYSFPSNHAANSAALATVFSSVYYQYRYFFWIMVLIVMFSRVYIGVHYPIDVITGCFIGTLYGLILVKWWDYFNKKKTEHPYSTT